MRVALLAATIALLLPAAARADTITFMRDGNIWLMAPDGSRQRQVSQGRDLAWPSEADDGTLVAQGGDYLYRFDQRFDALGAPVPTASLQTSDDLEIEQATHVRVSPDGTKIAYDEAFDDDVTALWTTADATSPNMGPGQE